MNNKKIQLALDASTSPGHTPIKAIYAKYGCGKSASSKCIVVLTNCGLDIREIRNAKLKTQKSWLDFEDIIVEKPALKLQFTTEKIIIISNEIHDFVEHLLDVIQRVITPSELAQTHFQDIDCPKVDPTPIGVLSRLSMFIPLQHPPLLKATLTLFETMLVSSQPIFNLFLFKDSRKFVPIFFELLSLMPFVDSVKIPLKKKLEVFKLVSEYILELKALQYLEISGTKDSGFDTFLRCLQLCKLNCISFCCSEFSKKDLEQLSISLLHSQIHAVELHNAVSQKGVDTNYFYSVFMASGVCDHIWSLNMDRTISIDLQSVIQNGKSLCSLSLMNCGIEVNSALSLISQNQMKNLTYLNLSGNICNGSSFDTNIKLPVSLTHICVNEVSWNDESLLLFFKVIFQLKELHLSIINVIALPHVWPMLFQLLHDSSYSMLRSLYWDENPVDSFFFGFLNQNQLLTSLSLNGCFHEALEDLFLLLIDYLKTNDILVKLSITGSKRVHLGKNVGKIIDACLLKQNLKILDLSISKCGMMYLPAFTPLFGDKSNLDVVVIDGIFPEDADPYVEFLRQVVMLKSNTKLSFPRGDIQMMKKSKKISQEQLKEISELYQLKEEKANDTTIHEYSAITNSLFDKPSRIYQYFNEPFIPPFITKEQYSFITSQNLDYDEDIRKEEAETTNDNNEIDLELSERKIKLWQTNESEKEEIANEEEEEDNFSDSFDEFEEPNDQSKEQTAETFCSIVLSPYASPNNRRESKISPKYESRTFFETQNNDDELESNASTISGESLKFSYTSEDNDNDKQNSSNILDSTKTSTTKDFPVIFTPQVQMLIEDFKTKYNFDENIQSKEFEDLNPGEEMWDQLNKEVSIDVLYRKLKGGKFCSKK